jgi:CubicO group peptidase (beta-lactamase class C family)
MELHTMGVDSGYTQKDIVEVARAFTGWTIADPRGYRKAAANEIKGIEDKRIERLQRQAGVPDDIESGQFYFNERWHDNEAKTVLGQKVNEGGVKDGLKVIDILLKHPATAKFIARKLAVKFVNDNPSEALVNRVANAFSKSNGDIKTTLRAIFTDDEFFAPDTYRAKIKSPFELAISAIRTIGADTTSSPAVLAMLNKLGEVPYGYQAPTGYPDTAEDWVNTGALLERLNFAVALSANQIPGTRVDLKRFEAPDKTAIMNKAIAAVLDNDISPTTKASLLKQVEQPLPDVKAPAEADGDDALEVPNMRPAGPAGGRNGCIQGCQFGTRDTRVPAAMIKGASTVMARDRHPAFRSPAFFVQVAMKNKALILLTAILCLGCHANAQNALSEQQRYKLAAEYSEQSRGLSVLVMKGDKIVFEEYQNGHSADRPWMLASGTKSFSGVLLAAAIEDGLIRSFDEKVSDTITEWKNDPRKSKITIRQLLSLTSGIEVGQIGRVPMYSEAINSTSSYDPGTHFEYGPVPFQTFGELMIRKLRPKNETVMSYLKRRVLDPIGLKVASWRDFDGQPLLPHGASLTAREWAKFGLLLKNGGRWNGKQIIRKTLLDELVKGSKTNPAYGLTFWLNKPGIDPRGQPTQARFEDISRTGLVGVNELYMAAGAGNQRLYIIPSLDMVVVRQGRLAPYDDREFLTRLLLGRSSS